MRIADASARVYAQYTRRAGGVVGMGYILALCSTVAFSFAPPVARFAILGGFDSNALLMTRMVIGTVLFAVTFAAADREKLRLSRRGVGATLLVGAVNASAMITFFLALNYLEASLAAMIIALSPPFLLSLLALRGEKLTRRQLVRLTLALTGVYLLVGPSGQANWLGVGLALLSTFLFSVQMALTQWTLIGYPVRSVVLYVTGSMAVFVVGWWLFQGAQWTAPSPAGWLAVAVLAIVCTYVARMAYFAAVPRIGSAQLALLGPLETMLTVVWSVLFLGERLAPVQVAGGLLILASALLAFRRLGRIPLRIPRR